MSNIYIAGVKIIIKPILIIQEIYMYTVWKVVIDKVFRFITMTLIHIPLTSLNLIIV